MVRASGGLSPLERQGRGDAGGRGPYRHALIDGHRDMNILSRREALLAGDGFACGAGRAAGGADTALRIGHGLPATHPVHPSMQHFADIVRDRTGGALESPSFPMDRSGRR